MNRYFNLINNTFKWQFFATIYITILQVVTLILLGRYLDNTALGSFAVFQMIFRMALAIFDPGMFFSVVQKHEVSSKLLKLLTRHQLLYLFICIIILCFSIFVFKINYISNIILIAFSFLILFLIGVGSYTQQVLILKDKQKDIAIIQMLAYSIELVVLLILLRYYSPVYCFSFSIIIRFFVMYLINYLYGKTLPDSTNGNQIDFVSHIHSSRFNLYNQVLSFIQGHYDTAFIILMFGLSILGPYNLAIEFSFILFSKVNPLFNKSIFPVIAKARKEHQVPDSMMARQFINFICVIVPLYLILYVNSNSILTWAYLEKGSEIYYYSSFILFVALIKAFNNILFTYLLASGATKSIFYWNTGILLINYSICFILYWNQWSMDHFLYFSVAYSFVVLLFLMIQTSYHFPFFFNEVKSNGLTAFLILFFLILILFGLQMVLHNPILLLVLSISVYVLLFLILDRKRLFNLLNLKIV